MRNKIIVEKDNGFEITETVIEAGQERVVARNVYQKGTKEHDEKKEMVDKL